MGPLRVHSRTHLYTLRFPLSMRTSHTKGDFYPVSAVSQNNQLRITLTPKRHIWGDIILYPSRARQRDEDTRTCSCADERSAWGCAAGARDLRVAPGSVHTRPGTWGFTDTEQEASGLDITEEAWGRDSR